MIRHARANLIGYVALFCALSGSAVATTAQLVTSADIADGTIVNADVSASAGIAGAKLARESVTSRQVVESTLAKVPNADRLDGIDSAEFLRGSGRFARLAIPIGDATQVRIAGLPVETLVLECRDLNAGRVGTDGEPLPPLGGLQPSGGRGAVLLGTFVAAELGKAREPEIPVEVRVSESPIALVPWSPTPGFPDDQPVYGVLPAEDAWHRVELSVQDAASGETAWVTYLGRGGPDGCVVNWRSVRSAVAP